MGILDMVNSFAGNMGDGGGAAKVGAGLMQEIASSPGGVSGVFQSFQQNGLGGLIQQWGSGQTGAASPDQIEQGLSNSSIVQNVAARTGMSPEEVKGGLAILMPLVIHHYVSNVHVTPEGEPTGVPPPDSGSMLQSVLGRLI